MVFRHLVLKCRYAVDYAFFDLLFKFWCNLVLAPAHILHNKACIRRQAVENYELVVFYLVGGSKRLLVDYIPLNAVFLRTVIYALSYIRVEILACSQIKHIVKRREIADSEARLSACHTARDKNLI